MVFVTKNTGQEAKEEEQEEQEEMCLWDESVNTAGSIVVPRQGPDVQNALFFE